MYWWPVFRNMATVHASIHPWSNLLSSPREYLPQDNIFCIPTTGVRMSRGRVSKSVCQRKAEEMLITKIFNLKCFLRLTCPCGSLCSGCSAFVSICVKALLKKMFQERPLCFLMDRLGSDRLFSVTQLLKNVPC